MTEATIGSNSNELSLDVTVQKLTFSAQTDSSVSSTIEESTGLNALFNETGKIYLSVDGRGTFDSTGSVRVDKKPGATVRKAYLVADGTNITSSVIGTTAGINGTSINWDRTESTTVSSFSFYSYLSDVTSLVKPTIDAATDGIISIAVDEGNESASYEGLALAVLFDDPSQPADSSVILYFGGLRPTGATSTINFSSPVDTSLTLGATLGLGIGFSNAPAGQTSQVKVNGQPLTQVAGNYDDGQFGNGALFTVGGIGDSPDNPPSDSTDPATDDELYNLLPFINNGDTSLTLETVNPSNDDHIFFAHLTLNGISAVNIPSTITFSTTNYSVQEDGTPITQVTLTRSGGIIGEVSVTLTPSDGTATAGSDYDNNPITVTFGDGETTKTVAIAVIDDTIYEGDKTVNLTLSDPTGGAILGNQINSTLTIVENEPVPQSVYTFTYTYGNGDSYSGYGYAAQGTYTVDQVLDGYTNETGNPGYYTINSVDKTDIVNNNSVYVTSYTDGDTGYGTTNSISSWGYNGLGSESGYAYNSAGGLDDFSNSNEADLINQQYTFTYTYGNGDSYSGYGYAAQGTYTVGQVLDGYTNETGNPGYYTIDSVDNAGTGNNNYVYVTSYTDGDTGYGSAYGGYGNGYNGLGSESGYAYNSAGGGDDFSNSNEADLINQQYTFTYTYGNGDSYSGFGYAAQGTYTVGQVLDGYTNETGNPGYYTIDSVDNAGTGNNNYVYVTSYTDGDTGYGTTNSISSWGYGGLGSEYGSAYNANYSGDTGFNSYYEADLPAVLQVRLNLLADNNGTPGEIISNDQVGLNRSFFVEIQVADLRGNAAGVNGLGLNLAWDGLILESIDTPFDPTNIITANFPLLQDGTVDNSSGLINNLSGGSLPAFELGQAIGVNQLERFALLRFQTENSTGTYYFTTTVDSAALADDNPYYSLDVETYQPIVVTPAYSQYNFTYNYGNGDSYTGYVYAVDGTYAAGQTIGGYNETGYPGQYTIDSITPTALDSSYNNRVYVTSYTDGDTGYGTTTNVSRDWQGVNGYGGLGSEGGNAYDVNGNSSDPYFSQYYEADIQNQLFNYTYTYGNGDSYSGYGYALAGTYTAGQVLGGYANETGYTGQYTIDSVSAVTTDSSYNNRVYVTSYTDGDTLYGETTNLYSYGGGSGFGSEYGYAYTAEGYTYDSYFSQYSEADLVIPGLAITDNSGNANDSSIKFTTELSKFRKNFQDSDYVRPNYADTTKYFDITNTGSGVLVVSDIQINVSGVTVNLDLSGDKDLLVNPGSSQRVNLTYDPLVAGENFDFDKNGSSLVLFTNIPDWSQYEVKLSGKSTFNSDINYDGKVNTGDLGSLNQARTNFNRGIFDGTADINGDGLISTLDANALTADIRLKLSV
ncbi:Calx-beta domain-containing protein [Anabaena sp. WA102]|uniref:Calx-beta domain-containing protein n=1 Tax=Anabaena sp. WA102 TaxID=1647413 RepID=UPI0006AC8764|nr:Calx-beta domain-containing protein [Anabaena sp. WA102]